MPFDPRPPRIEPPSSFRMPDEPEQPQGYLGKIDPYNQQQAHPEWAVRKPGWTFPGFRPYITRAATTVGIDENRANDARYLSMARDSWHGKQAQQLLGQLPPLMERIKAGTAGDHAQADMIDHLRLIYLSCVALQQGIAAAILDTTTELELPFPKWLELDTDGTRHLRPAVHDLVSSPANIEHHVGTAQGGGLESGPRQPRRR